MADETREIVNGIFAPAEAQTARIMKKNGAGGWNRCRAASQEGETCQEFDVGLLSASFISEMWGPGLYYFNWMVDEGGKRRPYGKSTEFEITALLAEPKKEPANGNHHAPMPTNADFASQMFAMLSAEREKGKQDGAQLLQTVIVLFQSQQQQEREQHAQRMEQMRHDHAAALERDRQFFGAMLASTQQQQQTQRDPNSIGLRELLPLLLDRDDGGEPWEHIGEAVGKIAKGFVGGGEDGEMIEDGPEGP